MNFEHELCHIDLKQNATNGHIMLRFFSQFFRFVSKLNIIQKMRHYILTLRR